MAVPGSLSVPSKAAFGAMIFGPAFGGGGGKGASWASATKSARNRFLASFDASGSAFFAVARQAAANFVAALAATASPASAAAFETPAATTLNKAASPRSSGARMVVSASPLLRDVPARTDAHKA